MKSKKIKHILFSLYLLVIPNSVFAISYGDNTEVSSLINFNAIIQSGAVVNDTTNAGNLNIIIIGMVVVILILVGAIMFAPKK